MSHGLYIAAALALFAGAVIDAQRKSSTVQHYHIRGEKGEVLYDFLPHSEFERVAPLLKVAVQINGRHEPKHVLRLLGLVNPTKDIPTIKRSFELRNVTNIPELKQWYRGTFLDEDGQFYGGRFGETVEGKPWTDPHVQFKLLRTSDLKNRTEKTRQLLEKGDFKGLYDYWMPPGTHRCTS